MTVESERKLIIRSWLIVIGITSVFVVWGLFVFFMVGHKGPIAWDYGIVEDIPGESPYSTYNRKAFMGTGPHEQAREPTPQHVDEPGGEAGAMQKNGGRR